LGCQAIIARSFGAIYERNAINSGFLVLIYDEIESLGLRSRDEVSIDLKNSLIINNSNGRKLSLRPISEVQLKIYQAGGILGNLEG
jgi:3-isopropylmalate dehydratase small subunit